MGEAQRNISDLKEESNKNTTWQQQSFPMAGAQARVAHKPAICETAPWWPLTATTSRRWSAKPSVGPSQSHELEFIIRILYELY